MSNEYCTSVNLSLTHYNSMRIKSVAEIMLLPYSEKGVTQIYNDFKGSDKLILGNGSNIILSREHYNTPIISSKLLKKIEFHNSYIEVESGVTLSELSWFALEHQISGFEYLEDIPGSVGGALCMNAGTYEEEIGSQVMSVTVYSIDLGRIQTIGEVELKKWWGRRDSYFLHHPCFIISCRLKVLDIRTTYSDILDKMLSIKRKRYEKQPRNFPSAGSVFKRPYVNNEPLYIWKLFDELGLRGYKIGDAQVSEKHPGFIVNCGNATGKELIDLLDYCKETVRNAYGIELEEEWKII